MGGPGSFTASCRRCLRLARLRGRRLTTSASCGSGSNDALIERSPLPILYLDNHLIAVHKPASLLSQGDQSGDEDALSVTRRHLERTLGKPKAYLGLVHRLDRNVSGVLVFARTSKAASRLSEQFRERCSGIVKLYCAVVVGKLKMGGELTHHLVPASGRDVNKMTVLPDHDIRPESGAQLASLAYTPLLDMVHHDKSGGFTQQTLVGVRLMSGRKHQIRAQLSHIGHPVVGDVKYGAPRALRTKELALHCCCLRVRHITRPNSFVTIQAPWPESLARRFDPAATDAVARFVRSSCEDESVAPQDEKDASLNGVV